MRCARRFRVDGTDTHVVSVSRESGLYRLQSEPQIYRHTRHFTSPRLLARRIRPFGLTREDVRYYTHFTRLAKLTCRLRLPLPLTADLFVAVFRKLPIVARCDRNNIQP